jgi:tetratricopeptide (TPR) repeat protein
LHLISNTRPQPLLELLRFSLARHVAWTAARATGWIIGWLWTGWRQPLLGIGFVLAVATAISSLLNRLHFWWVLWFAVLVCVLIAISRARRRIVLDPFVTYAPKSVGDIGAGLNTLLVHELTELRDLYRAIDEDVAITTAVQSNKPIPAALHVDDVTDFLTSGTTTESKVSLGPIAIPIGTILSGLGRFARGPRLVGSLHHDSTNTTLTIQLTGRGEFHSWQQDQDGCNGEPGLAAIPVMVRELALRIFTDLALSGSVRWQATAAFTEALRAMRDCTRTGRNTSVELRRAERYLTEALAEDRTLALAEYDLGVVYTRLGEAARTDADKAANFAAAARAFHVQIGRLPDRWNAYYALAMTHYNSLEMPYDQGHLDLVVPLCERVVAMETGRVGTAKALDLKCRAEQLLGRYAAARRSSISAVAYAYSALCRTELQWRLSSAGAERLTHARTVASACLLTLADQRAYPSPSEPESGRGALPAWPIWRVRRLVRRAASLQPSNFLPHYALALIAHYRSEFDLEEQELESAIRIQPMLSALWGQRALTYASQKSRLEPGSSAAIYKEVLARQAAKKGLRLADCSDPNESITFDRVADAYKALGDDHEAELVADMRDFYSGTRLEFSRDDRKSLEARVKDAKSKGDSWRWAQAEIALAQLAGTKSADAIQLLTDARERLQPDYAEEVARRGVHASLARALAKEERFKEALETANQGLGLDPVASYEREALGDIYIALQDREHARLAYEGALLWDPENLRLHKKLGKCHIELGGEYADAPKKVRAYEAAANVYEDAVELAGNDLDTKVAAHYWAGRSYKERGDYERALPHLRNAGIPVEARPVVALLVGEAYLRSGAFEQAENELTGVIELVEQTLKVGGNANHVVGVSVEDPTWALALVLGYGHCFRAFCWAEREVKFDEGLTEIRRARKEFKRLTYTPAVAIACCDDFEGWIRFKRRNKDDLDKALQLFERSLATIPDGEAYVHLAAASLEKLISTRIQSERRRWARRIIESCRLAVAADPTGRFAATAAEIRGELAAEHATTTTH